MLDELLNSINIIKILVLFTYLFTLFKLKFDTVVNKCLLVIISISLFNEVIVSILSFYSIKVQFVMTLWVILHHSLWLYLICYINNRKASFLTIIIFFIFAFYNLFFLQKPENFNYFTFVFGSFIYFILFFYLSFNQLKKENFAFIFSNDYLLLSCPIIFLFGLSVMFSFVSRDVTQTKVFFDKSLYDIVGYYGNIIYYLMINLYIYREWKIYTKT